MKTLHYTRPNNLGQLHRELLAAFPQWIQVQPDGTKQTNVTVSGQGDDIWLTVPDDTDESAVRLCLDAHTPQDPASPAPDSSQVVLAQTAASTGSLDAAALSDFARAAAQLLLKLTSR